MSTHDADRDDPDDLEWPWPEEGDCHYCEGTGEVVCNRCEGSGCPRCSDGARTCPECGGSGFADSCAGAGEDE